VPNRPRERERFEAVKISPSKLALEMELAARLQELEIPSEFFDSIKASAFISHGHVLVVDERRERESYLFHPQQKVRWGTYPPKASL
jgi:ribosomal protein S4